MVPWAHTYPVCHHADFVRYRSNTVGVRREFQTHLAAIPTPLSREREIPPRWFIVPNLVVLCQTL